MAVPRSLLIRGARICTPKAVIESGWLLTGDGRIAGLGPGAPPAGTGRTAQVVDARGITLLPGFIDIHVHGGDGADTMDADPAALVQLARFHARHGTTTLVPTTWAAEPSAVAAAVAAVASARGPVDGGATIAGAHLEGPWINPARAGAQDRSQIRPFNSGEAAALLGSDAVVLVTLAPEMPGSAALIAGCRRRGVVVSAGHTEATFADMEAAVAAGLTQVTHTFNAMSPFGHRDPGTAGAALLLDQLRCELIADGVHVHPAAMAVLARAKGPDGVILVTDATRATGLPDGEVDLGGRPGRHCGGTVRLEDGTLAGSALTFEVALANFARAAGWGWEHLWKAASGNAARSLGLDTKGALLPGRDADLVLLDEEGTVRLTVVGGRIVHGGDP